MKAKTENKAIFFGQLRENPFLKPYMLSVDDVEQLSVYYQDKLNICIFIRMDKPFRRF